jgi:LacI family transcriptional regulator
VVIDNFGGAFALTDHLIKRGHSRIAIVTGRPDQNFARERLWGYQQALADSGIKPQDKLAFIGGWYEQDGYDAIRKIQSMDEKPTAVLAANCSLCTGCIKACRDLGIEIGEELSLVGFDDNELAKFVSPGVTVISRPTFEMGHVAAEMLLGRINRGQPGENARKTTLPVHLLERGSVKRLT